MQLTRLFCGPVNTDSKKEQKPHGEAPHDEFQLSGFMIKAYQELPMKAMRISTNKRA